MLPRRAAWILAPLLLAAGIAACSSYGSDDATVAPSDAGPDVADSAAPTDAADANASADAGPCADPTKSFCDDFDEMPLAAKWTTVTQERGTLALQASDRSPPYALSATATAAAKAGDVALVQKLPGIPASVVCEVDVKVTAASGYFDVLGISTVGSGGAEEAIAVIHDNGTWKLGEFSTFGDGGETDQTVVLSDVAKDRWLHIVLATDFGNKTVSASIASSTMSLDISPPPATSRLVGLGLIFVQPTSTASVLFDDFVCTFR